MDKNTAKETRTVRTSEAMNIYGILSGLRLGRLCRADQMAALRLCRALRPVAEAFNTAREETCERLRPEGWEETQTRFRSIDTLPEEERGPVREAVARYETAVGECMREVMEQPAEIPTGLTVTEDFATSLLESNPELELGAVLYLENFFTLSGADTPENNSSSKTTRK